MLTWDEEVKPTSPAPNSSVSYQNREVDHSPLSLASHIPQPALRTLDDVALRAPIAQTTAPQSAFDVSRGSAKHRVKASDKRIINGQTDVNQLVPFKYKWAW